jgi:hypothetical protein
MPVLIYERVKTTRRLRLFRRYKSKLIFIGRLNFLGILLLGFRGHWFLIGTKYGQPVHEGLRVILETAKLDDRVYKVLDWFPNKGRLIIYVTRDLHN